MMVSFMKFRLERRLNKDHIQKEPFAFLILSKFTMMISCVRK
jgi:hypothetical protein